jgi:hypothetical protein
MNSLDEQIEAVTAMLIAAGGVVGIEPDAPDYVKRAFLEMILSCPDCREMIRGKHDGNAN